jgi:hypothetical protein
VKQPNRNIGCSNMSNPPSRRMGIGCVLEIYYSDQLGTGFCLQCSYLVILFWEALLVIPHLSSTEVMIRLYFVHACTFPQIRKLQYLLCNVAFSLRLIATVSPRPIFFVGFAQRGVFLGSCGGVTMVSRFCGVTPRRFLVAGQCGGNLAVPNLDYVLPCL